MVRGCGLWEGEREIEANVCLYVGVKPVLPSLPSSLSSPSPSPLPPAPSLLLPVYLLPPSPAVVLSNSDREEGVEEEEEEEELDEEDEWLNALESGAVNERGYLPQKEAAVLTARQVRL